VRVTTFTSSLLRPSCTPRKNSAGFRTPRQTGAPEQPLQAPAVRAVHLEESWPVWGGGGRGEKRKEAPGASETHTHTHTHIHTHTHTKKVRLSGLSRGGNRVTITQRFTPLNPAFNPARHGSARGRAPFMCGRETREP